MDQQPCPPSPLTVKYESNLFLAQTTSRDNKQLKPKQTLFETTKSLQLERLRYDLAAIILHDLQIYSDCL